MTTIRFEPDDTGIIKGVILEFEIDGIWNPNAPAADIELQQEILLKQLAMLTQLFTMQLGAVIQSPLSIVFLDQMRRALIEVSYRQVTMMERLRAGDDPHRMVAEYAKEVGEETNEPDPGPKEDLSVWTDALDDSPLDDDIEDDEAE